MHELSLCAAIADIVRDRVRGRELRTVRLQIGELRQVVPDTLTYCWGMVTDSTPLGGSQLEIERVAARLRCSSCGAEHDLGTEFRFACDSCGGTDVTVIAGEEFLVTSIDVAVESEAAR
jgi:hydrogenase nickel incorporation protein HypA/HybF